MGDAKCLDKTAVHGPSNNHAEICQDIGLVTHQTRIGSSSSEGTVSEAQITTASFLTPAGTMLGSLWAAGLQGQTPALCPKWAFPDWGSRGFLGVRKAEAEGHEASCVPTDPPQLPVCSALSSSYELTWPARALPWTRPELANSNVTQTSGRVRISAFIWT